MVTHKSVKVQWVLSGTYLGIMGKMKKIKMLVRVVGILLYVMISGEGLPLKTLLCHPSSSFVTLINAVAVGHYTLELGLSSLVCKVLCPSLLPGHSPTHKMPCPWQRKSST
jgi:hypothetical protein